jgi:hypothetical protein
MLGRCADLSVLGEPSKKYISIPLQDIHGRCIFYTSSREIERYGKLLRLLRYQGFKHTQDRP